MTDDVSRDISFDAFAAGMNAYRDAVLAGLRTPASVR